MNRFPLGAALALCCFPLLTAAPQAPASVGTIVVAHGGDSLWNSQVEAAAAAARTGGPVRVSFLMGPGAARSRFQEVVTSLEAEGVDSIVVVPMLVSSHSGHFDQIRWLAGDSVALDETMRHHLHMSGIERPRTTLPIRMRRALDDAPELSEVLTERGLSLARTLGAEPRARALLIVGHGPNSAEDNAAWMANLRRVASRVQEATGFRDVRVDLVRDDAPAAVRAEAVRHVRELLELQRAMTGADVLVLPLLVSKGAVSRDKLPADLAGTPHRYGGETLLPHPAMVRWIEARTAGR